MRKHIVKNPITWYYVVSTLRGIDFIGAVLIPFFMQWGHLTQDKIQFMQTWFWIWTAVLDFPTGLLAVLPLIAFLMPLPRDDEKTE